MKTTSRVALSLLCALFSVFCVASVVADAPATFKVGSFTFTRPATWEWVEVTSAMRKAQLRVREMDSNASAEAIFYYFGQGDGGGTKANVDRWLGQFQEPRGKINAKVEEVTVGKTKITCVQAEGTYSSGMPGGPTTPMADYALLGAILESEQGNVFVRMTGPKALVKSSVADFKKMIESGPIRN